MFSKSYVISQLEFTLNNIVLNYCLLDATCFNYADDNFIKVTSLYDIRLTAPNSTAQPNQCHEKKSVNIHCEEKILWSWLIWQNCCQETTVKEAKQCQKNPVGQGTQRLEIRPME